MRRNLRAHYSTDVAFALTVLLVAIVSFWTAMCTVGVVCAAEMPTADAKAIIQDIGHVWTVSPSTFAIGVSADGSTVVGSSSRTGSRPNGSAFRWTNGGVIAALGDLPGGEVNALAFAVSADGTIVAGFSDSEFGREAFRWTQPEGMVGLGDLSGGRFLSQIFGMSADGSVMVGSSFPSFARNLEAFRYTEAGGMIGLGDLAGGIAQSSAEDISSDGAVIVGWGTSEVGIEAFRWPVTDGMVGLGNLPGGVFNSGASAISANGLVIVGHSDNPTAREAFRWTIDTGMVSLASPLGEGHGMIAKDVSADGSVIVGNCETWNSSDAFIWDTDHGMRLLQDVLINDFDVDLTDWHLYTATGVSDDGRVIVGWGDHAGTTSAYHLELPCKLTTVAVDIKPGNDTNPVNLGARGVLPVAVLTTSVADGDLTDFDAADVDPSSLTLAGAAPRMKGRSGRVGSLADIDGDGDLDLLLHFPIADL